MINNSYKIWITIFVIINIFLLVWSLGYLNLLISKISLQEDITVIKPDNVFIKQAPPEDESFPHEKSKVWDAFKNKENQPDNVQAIESEETTMENEDYALKNKEVVNQNLSVLNSNEDKNDNFKYKKLKNKSKTEEIVTIDEQKKNNIDIENNESKKKLFYVQVASLSKKNLVEKEWKRLKEKHSEYISDLIYISQKTKLEDERTFFRLLIGTFNGKEEANIFCKKLNMNKCFIKVVNE